MTWKVAIIKVLYKKPDRSNCNNDRGSPVSSRTQAKNMRLNIVASCLRDYCKARHLPG